jgi:TrmH family RNA methyltransferase
MDRTADATIRSPDNRIVKLVRTLRQRKTREAERLFVVEGMRHVEDALASGGVARFVLLREGTTWHPDPPAEPGTGVRTVAGPLFDRLSGSVTPQPVMAVFEFPTVDVAAQSDPLVLVIDGLQDPGNLGTMLRSAAAADVALVLLGKGTVDPFNDKVVRAAMGAHFRVAVRWLDDEWKTWLQRTCGTRVVADATGEHPYWEQDWSAGTAIIVGGEAHGVSDGLKEIATGSVRIPVARAVESLNAAVAASILLFEANRKRGSSPSS